MAKDKIKVIHVLGKLQMGGAETLVMNIYRNIDRSKIQFDFIVHGDEIGDYEEEILKMGGKIYRVPKYKGYNHFEYKKSWNIFFREHPEYKIIHCHIRSTASIILKIAKKYDLKTISHSHSTSNGTGIKSIIKRFFQKSICKNADFLFACSENSGKWLYGNFWDLKNKNCILINNAIDSTKYIYNSDIRNKVRNKLKINNKIVLGQVGRLEKVKNHEFSLFILSELLKYNEDFVLLIVGEGSLKNNLLDKVNLLSLNNNVIFLGNRNDVNELMQAMDIFLMPSFWEGLPLSLIEAQASDLPCIVSENISAGILDKNLIKKIDLNNIDEWINEINGLYLHKRCDNHNLIVNKNFDITKNVEIIESLYTDMERDDIYE